MRSTRTGSLKSDQKIRFPRVSRSLAQTERIAGSEYEIEQHVEGWVDKRAKILLAALNMKGWMHEKKEEDSWVDEYMHDGGPKDRQTEKEYSTKIWTKKMNRPEA